MQVILQGSLRHFPAAELLGFLCNHSRKGTLDVEAQGRRTRILFGDDAIIWAESRNVPDAVDAILDVFSWEAGSFTLLDGFELPPYATPLHLTLAALHDEAKRRAEAGPYRDDTLFRVVENPAQQQVSLTGDEFKILFRIAGGRTLADLVADLALDRKVLVESLQRFEELGLVRSGGEEPAAPEIPQNPFAPKSDAVAVQEDAEATRIERVRPDQQRIATVAQQSAVPASPAPAQPAPATPQQPAPAAPQQSAPAAPQQPAPAAAQRPAPAAPPPASVTPPPPPQPPAAPPQTVARRKTVVGSLTPDDAPDSIYPLLEDECVIGRAPGVGITIPDGSVSSRHARIVRSDEGFTVEDLQSRNGTFVNGEKVDKPRLLADGDLVRIGKVILTFSLAREAAPVETTQPEIKL